MLNFFAPVFVLGIITLGAYRIIELFVRRRERMLIIDKMHSCSNPAMLTNQLHMSLIGKPRYSNWTLRASLLLIGLGIGFIIGLLIQLAIIYQLDRMDINLIRNLTEIVYFASTLLFGGIGLLVAYLIERKDEKKQV